MSSWLLINHRVLNLSLHLAQRRSPPESEPQSSTPKGDNNNQEGESDTMYKHYQSVKANGKAKGGPDTFPSLGKCGSMVSSSTGVSIVDVGLDHHPMIVSDSSSLDIPSSPSASSIGSSSSTQSNHSHIKTYISVYNGSSSVAAGNAPNPVPPSSAQVASGTPRNVRDALNILSANREAAKTPLKANNNAPTDAKMDSNRRAYATPSGDKPLSETTRERHPVDVQPKKPKQLDGYVGFANLPNQVYRKAVKKGFEFTLMVAGESGLGKSTLINSMFLTDVYSAEYPGPSARIKKTVKVDTNKVLMQENGVNLTLTIVDTPGFGDAVDNSDCWDPVIQYVETQYENFLDAETRVNRISLPDTRVHSCLYFIAPSGHGLKPLDVEFMQRLHDKVNIIPVIAKADTMTPEEIVHFKKQIMNQIVQNRIKIYEFPESEGDEENERRENQKMKDRVPFAVVGSNTVIENADGKKTRGRKYPWGIVDIENLDHCDFIPLRNMLIRTNLQDLKEVTNDVHYENYRCRKLAGVAGGSVDKIPNRNPMAQIEEERREHHNKLLKMEKEMEEVFERKVREKKQKLSDSESDLEKRHKESKEKLDQQKRDLENKMKAFEHDRLAWEQAHNITIDELKRMSMESLDGGKKKKGGALSGVSFRMGR